MSAVVPVSCDWARAIGAAMRRAMALVVRNFIVNLVSV
jgi:hypothetical protein